MKRFLHVLFAALVVAGATVLTAAEARSGSDSKSGTDAAGMPAARLVILKGTYADHPLASGFDPTSLLLGEFEQPKSFATLSEKLDEFGRQGAIDHVLFDLSAPNLNLNLAQLSELSRRLGALKAAGKRTVAWLENASTIHYSIASACDTIVMTEVGSLDLPSLSLASLHFKDAMDLLGAEASYARTGDFKGAVEPFTRSEMSPELRAHYREMVQSMNDALVDRLAAARKLPREQVRKLQGERIFTPRAAKEAGLVDLLVPAGTQSETVRRLAQKELRWIEPPSSKPKPMSFLELMSKVLGSVAERKTAAPGIAVLHLDGQIVDGETAMPGSMVAGTTVKAIGEVARDASVRGVVVRINSPGGSATASEAIRRALEDLAKKKPLVFSMGDMAASGGYWITCIGRPIYAEPQTLTGSIGVFALKLSIGPLMKKVGVRMESVLLDESAGSMALDRGWTPAEIAKMQGFVSEIYDRFLQLAAASRHLETNQVAAVASGRVWSGQQAVKLKLVDQLGGLDDAVAAVAREAGLSKDAPVVHRPRAKSMFETFDLFGEASDEIRLGLSAETRAFLRQSGFNLAVPLTLIRESLSGQGPKAWLLAPTEFKIR